MQLPFLFNWKKSKAHFELLSKFIKCESLEHFTDNNQRLSGWSEVLKESPKKSIQRFINEKLLQEANLHDSLESLLRGNELKALCSERGLKVSGKKSELVERLIANDELGMKKL